MLFVVLSAALAITLAVSEYRERRNWARFSERVLSQFDKLDEVFENQLEQFKAFNSELASIIEENERKLKA